jgi:UDP-glucose 4-epimerase
MRYLVTGGAGFIGSYLTADLLAQDAQVSVIDDLSTGRFSNLKELAGHPNLRIVIGSVLDHDLLEPLVQNADAVFHLASAVGVKLIMEQPVQTIETIFQGTDAVLKFAARYRRKVLLTSTSEVYGKSENIPFREDGDRLEGPTTMHRWAYACAKALDEFLALAHHKKSGLPVVVARLFNAVGPRQASQYGMVIPRFVEAALRGEALTVYGDGSQQRCFCHVSDTVRALQAAMAAPSCDGEVLNVGSVEEVSMLELAQRVIKRAKSRSAIVTIPYQQAFPDGGFEDMKRRVPSIEKIGRLVGWTPQKSLDQILEDVIAERRSLLRL